MTTSLDTTGQIRAHVREINRCKQRGGRMLSLLDLIEAGSSDLPMAAYLAAAMRKGSSLLVGARPGGAGKTAVMCALLNWLPDRTRLQAAADDSVLDKARRSTRLGETCILAHEIGAGYYYAYIWDGQARAFFALAGQGHLIAANLHADTLPETYDQLCVENGVQREHVAAVQLKVYLGMTRVQGRHYRRWISHVYESDGQRDRLLWTHDGEGHCERLGPSRLVSAKEETEHAALLEDMIQRGVYTIEAVRTRLLE